MKTLQIACDNNDWNNSTITVLGLMRNGRRALPKSFLAHDLEQPWFSVWEGLVSSLKSIAPNEWAAQFIEASLTITEENEKQVVLTIHRKWDDNTTDEPFVMVMGGMAIEFFEFLTIDI